MALYAATGLLIRTTADDLLKRVFTKTNPGRGDIRVVFYITKKDKRHGDGYAAAGTATHVAGIIGDGVILNSQEPYALIRQIYEVSDWYQKEGHEVLIRGLNREALEKLAREGKTRYGLDSEFQRYFDI
jgi:murein DD-endopeptidase